MLLVLPLHLDRTLRAHALKKSTRTTRLAAMRIEAGRVLHHLKAAVESPKNTIAIVGFQAQHTLGRRLVEKRPRVKIFGGLGGMMFLEELRHGAIGTMTGFAFPEILVEIHRRYTSGDIDGATATFYKYCPLIRFENQPRINLALRKHIYHLRGVIASPRVRSPFTAVDEGTLADLDDLLRRLSLAPASVAS